MERWIKYLIFAHEPLINQTLNTSRLYAEYGISMGTRFSEHLQLIRARWWVFLTCISVSLSVVTKQTNRNMLCNL